MPPVPLNPQPMIQTIASEFCIDGDLVEVTPLGHGHINDTFVATYRHAGRPTRYVHQRINQHVFHDPEAVMDNIARVTQHIRAKLLAAGATDVARRVLTLVPARDGGAFHRAADGSYWRTYLFIENAHICDVVETPQQAYQVGLAFGQFQQQLADLPAPRLAETIPHFHDTPQRFVKLEQSIARDAVNRVAQAKPEIEFALRHKEMTGMLLDLHARGAIPERITHNDTKFNNVMLDDATGKALCVLDLDTVMPGLALYDFGDMVRTATCACAEDETDLSKVRMEMPMFEALARGYLAAVGSVLNDTEKRHLAFAGKLMTFEVGIRFLTDHLEGDHYFKVHRPAHNLDRCRNQFALVESIAAQEDAMNRVAARVSAE
jgi:hypothetical protein